ncbi:Pentatricopeptide repeat-containing protein [Quillaja saponaria]|uniref:Pentatricopeptide repeat-containing protein n=1 Tax=Quillaja saponaria TaxID=32244 RepID=A0AAD7LF30_QUISA|nr:Pentatricopeptide repeat-containing protein [Quillaja saponaria]
MSDKNLITWSSMVSMYTQHHYNEEALMIFSQFRRSCSENPNEYILASVIRACTQLGSVNLGAQVHCFALKSGLIQDVYVGTSLVDCYAKQGNIDEARLVFDCLAVKTNVTWTTIITGYAKNGRCELSLKLFNQMRETSLLPDKYVLCSILSACSVLEFLEGGKQIHAYVLRRGTEMDVSLINVLIDFYSKSRKVETGRRLFDQMIDKNLVSWTTMIAGYMQNSFDWEAMKLFVEMAQLGWMADKFACTSILTSCGSLNALEKGRQVHAYIIKANLGNDDFVKNGLIDMYAKCDSLTDARKVFDLLADTNVVSYNAMIEGYSRQEKLYEALDLFNDMRLKLFPAKSLDIYVYSKCSSVSNARLVFEEINEKDIVVWNAMFFGYTQQLENEEALKLYKSLQISREKPNEFTLAALITAASNLASLQHGQQFHNQLIKLGLDNDPFVTNALQHGEAEEALEMFEGMIKEGIKPNHVTFVALLTACSHSGLVELGLRYFNSMTKFGIEPGTEHYACIVSLLGRTGKIFEAKEFIEKMPIKPAAVVWRSLLSACRLVGNVELGRYAAEMAISSDPEDSGSYILLSNIFASKGMWVDVKRVREKMDVNGVVKEPGGSWMEVNNEVHMFFARDTTHRDTELISSVLDDLILQIKRVGYGPHTATLAINDS